MGVTAYELGIPAVRASARRDPARPADPRLVDSFGRVATDLRISLTDRCNLRCSYCMPAEGLDWMPRAEQLTDEELVRLVTIAVRDLGIQELRFTGGEPLLRRGLESLIAAAAALRPRPDISLTTNGIGLARRADALAEPGVNRLNVSMNRSSYPCSTANRSRGTASSSLTPRSSTAFIFTGTRPACADAASPASTSACRSRRVRVRNLAGSTG